MAENDSELTAEEFFEAMQAEAQEADPDLEDRLKALDSIAAQRRKDPDLEARYEQLRDELQAELKETGPRYYLDEHGLKRYAYRVAPEKLAIDVDDLVAMVEAGEIDVDLDKVAPRKIDGEQMKRAIRKGSVAAAKKAAIPKGGIPPEKLVKLGRIVPSAAPHVRFSDPRDDL